MGHPLRQLLTFQASPHRVYQALTDSSVFSHMTGASAEIDSQAGGEFSCFDGKIVGRTIESCPDSLLVLAWRIDTWEPALYSVARFTITGEGDSTELALHHNGFPKGQAEHLANKWYTHYWDPMTRLFSGES